MQGKWRFSFGFTSPFIQLNPEGALKKAQDTPKLSLTQPRKRGVADRPGVKAGSKEPAIS